MICMPSLKGDVMRSAVVTIIMCLCLSPIQALDLIYAMDSFLQESRPTLAPEHQRTLRNHFLRLRSDMAEPLEEHRFLELVKRETASWRDYQWRRMTRSSLSAGFDTMMTGLAEGLAAYPEDAELWELEPHYETLGLLTEQLMQNWLGSAESMRTPSGHGSVAYELAQVTASIYQKADVSWTPLPGSELEAYWHRAETAFLSRWLRRFAEHHLTLYLDTMQRYRTHRFWAISDIGQRLERYREWDEKAARAKVERLTAFLSDMPFVWRDADTHEIFFHEFALQLLVVERPIEGIRSLVDGVTKEGFTSYPLLSE